jgi:hypothetical protein
MEQKWTNKLNNDEFNLISDTWYPILKKGAIEKIKAQLANLGIQMQDNQPHLSYKISAGENYQNLPYLVLDFPKISGPNFPFVFRTLFWWGKPISCQVLVRTNLHKNTIDKIISMSHPNTLVLIGDNLWENDFNSIDFKRKSDLSDFDKASLASKDYFKLVHTFEMKKPDTLFEEAIGFYENYKELFLTS